MHPTPQSPPFTARPVVHRLALVWALAALFAVVNGLFVLRRLPILHVESNTPEEQATRSAAQWLQEQPANARLLLLRSHRKDGAIWLRFHREDGAIWFNFRLNYRIYPRRHATAWEPLPPDADHKYDLILAIGAARSAVPTGWLPQYQDAFATLFRRASYHPTVAPAGTPSPSLNLVGALFALAVPVVLGALLLVWTSPEAPFPVWWANLALAHLIGATALTWLVTVTATAAGKLLVWPVYLLLALLLPFTRRLTIRKRRDENPQITQIDTDFQSPEHYGPQSRSGLLLYRAALWMVILLGLAMTVQNARMLGVGWDGYSIWQFKARAFLIDGDLSILRDMHFADYAHLDYPPLVPLQTWWVGAHAGGYRELYAHLIGVQFALDLVLLFAAFARRWVWRDHLLLGLALLVTIPEACGHAVSGFADIEMACYLLALATLLARVVACNERRLRPALVWMFAGIVLVKNEGLMAALSGLTVLLLWWRGRELAAVACCAAGAAVAYLPWFGLKRAWHLSNDLLEGGRNPHYTVGLIVWRLGVALRGFVACLAQLGPRAGGWGLPIVLLPIGLVETLRRRIAVCYPLWLLCAVQLAGYVLIYLITPLPLKAHMASSVSRLILHLLPTLLLASLVGTFGMEESRNPP
jgi:hypothetical protein